MGKRGYGSSGLGKVNKRGKNGNVAVSGKSSRHKGFEKSRSAGPGQRQHSRWEAKAKAGKKDVRRAHSGEAEKEETRQRLRLKALQKQLARLTDSSGPVEQRVAVLRDLGKMHMDAGRSQAASDAFRQALQLQPEDPDFIRTPLLCMHMDAAQTDEASEALKGPLFTPLLLEAGIDLAADARAAAGKSKARRLAGAEAEAGAGAAEPGPSAMQETTDCSISSEACNAATLTACYTVALLTYISVRVLQEHGRKPSSVNAAEAKLARRLRAAKQQNPFVAEFIAFAPAFEQHFDGYGERRDLKGKRPFGSEQMLIQTLDYCFQHRQLAIWLDTNDEVRRYIQRTLFEEEQPKSGNAPGDTAEEEPPLAPLPSETPADHPVMRTWRKAREAALELWAEEMSTADDCEGEEEESVESSSEALARAEAQMADV